MIYAFTDQDRREAAAMAKLWREDNLKHGRRDTDGSTADPRAIRKRTIEGLLSELAYSRLTGLRLECHRSRHPEGRRRRNL
jgi:hypothetical protein